MRARLLAICIAALAASGCGGDDETTVITPTTVIETQTVTVPPAPDKTTPEEEPQDDKPGAREDGDGAAEAPGNDGAAEAPGRCGHITFEENTDSGASGIAAVGVDCATARDIARAARGRTQLSYETRGFSCRGTRNDDAPLPSVEWVCVSQSDAFVRFETT